MWLLIWRRRDDRGDRSENPPDPIADPSEILIHDDHYSVDFEFATTGCQRPWSPPPAGTTFFDWPTRLRQDNVTKLADHSAAPRI
jgi:hypothetical protein